MTKSVSRLAIAAAAIALVLVAAGSVSAAAQGTIGSKSFRSATLGEDIA